MLVLFYKRDYFLLYVLYLNDFTWVILSLTTNIKSLNTYWTRRSPASSLLHMEKVILGEAKLSPTLFCPDAINWMLDEVKSNKCFIVSKNRLK